MDNPLLALQVQTPDIAGSFQRGQAQGQEMQTARLGNMLRSYQLQKAQREDASANMLRQFYQQHGPGLVNNNPDDVNALAQIDPEAAIGYRDKATTSASNNLELAHKKVEFIGNLASGVLNSPAEVRPLMYQKALQTAKDNGIDVSNFPPQYNEGAVKSFMSQAVSVKDQIANQMDQQKFAETQRHNRVDEGTAAQNAQATMINATSGNKQWQVLTDPKTNTQYRYNPVTGDATMLDGKTPYTPTGAAKMTSGQPRSASTLAVQKYVQEHPDATAEDITQFAADFTKTNKSVGAFGTGKQGDLLRSFNVAISHLNTLDGLVDGLGNGNVQALNKASNAWKQQTGFAAPSNFDAAKAIVGDEIIKAIVGGGGALADRENAQNQINRANSPEQLRGVIKTYKDLMGGQLKGLKKQYTDTTGRNDFDKRLEPETAKELEGIPASASTPAKTSSGATVSNWPGQ